MRRVLVTGGNRGIGLELVRHLLARGDKVVAAVRHPARANELTLQAAAHPGHLHVLPLDVTKPASIHELAKEAALVVDGLDLLINNAGLLPSGERFGHLDSHALEAAFRTNAMGPLLLSEALTPLLRRGQQAWIANISTVMGSITETREFRTPSYAISKAALNMVTRLLAAALREHGIGVLALHPGWVQTAMGGAQAPVPAATSAAGLLRVIDAAALEQSGSFLDYQGQSLPW